MGNDMYIKIVASGLATLFFALKRQTPKRVLIIAAFLGALGWTIYKIIEPSSAIAGNFTAALVIGISSEIFARIKKTPSTVILICGIIPLVPGVKFYETMLFFVSGETDNAINAGVSTLLATGSLVFAVIISNLIGKYIITPIAKKIIAKRVAKSDVKGTN